MFFTVVEILVVTIACCAASVHYIHALQMGRYQLPAYRQWLSRNRDRILKDNVLWAFAAALARAYLPVVLSMFLKEEEFRSALSGWLVLGLFTALMAWITWRDYTMPSRKPFVVTQRVRRLMTALFLLSLAATTLMAMMRPISVSPYFLYALMPFMVLAAAAIMDPYEARLNAGFFKSAKKKIRAHADLITIGITGSYGKTNVKFILRDILSKKYKVLATPASFNTAMGISRVINDQLKPEHQVFIAEMGATHATWTPSAPSKISPAPSSSWCRACPGTGWLCSAGATITSTAFTPCAGMRSAASAWKAIPGPSCAPKTSPTATGAPPLTWSAPTVGPCAAARGCWASTTSRTSCWRRPWPGRWAWRWPRSPRP